MIEVYYDTGKKYIVETPKTYKKSIMHLDQLREKANPNEIFF